MTGREAFVLGVSTFCKTAEMDAEDTTAFVELLMSDPQLGVATIKRAKLDPELQQLVKDAWSWGGAGSGALSGAGTGAYLGSVIPGIGTAIGAGIGTVGGGLLGGFLGGGGGEGASARAAQQPSRPNFNQEQLDWIRQTYGSNMGGGARGAMGATGAGGRIPGTVGYGWGQAQGTPQFTRMMSGGAGAMGGGAQEERVGMQTGPEELNEAEGEIYDKEVEKLMAPYSEEQRRLLPNLDQQVEDAGKRAVEAYRKSQLSGLTPEQRTMAGLEPAEAAGGKNVETGSAEHPTALVGDYAGSMGLGLDDRNLRAAAEAGNQRKGFERRSRRFARQFGLSFGDLERMTPEHMAAGKYAPSVMKEFRGIQEHLSRRRGAAGGKPYAMYGGGFGMPSAKPGVPGTAAPAVAGAQGSPYLEPGGPPTRQAPALASGASGAAPASPMSPQPTGTTSAKGQPGPLGPPGSTMPTPEATHPAVLAAKEMPSSSPPVTRTGYGRQPTTSATGRAATGAAQQTPAPRGDMTPAGAQTFMRGRRQAVEAGVLKR